MTNFIDQLIKLRACTPAIEWAKGQPDLRTAWNNCQRGDWMLWFYKKLHPKNIRELTLAKGHCANTVRHLMKDERSIAAVDAAIDFGEGKISIEELKNAAYAAAAAAYAAADAAAYAAYAAAAAAYAYAADAAAYAADAAAYAAYAAAAAAYAADAANQKQTADICRQFLTI